MKRKEFKTTVYKNDKLIFEATNYAWNKAHQSITKTIRELATVGEVWTMIDKYYAKNEFKEHIDCVQHWENESNDLIRFCIEKVGE